jgi:uncharacterized FlgJ-related protein
MTDHTKIEAAAFELWQDIRSADFDVLMANRHGAEDSFRAAIRKLRAAADTAEAALAVKEVAE